MDDDTLRWTDLTQIGEGRYEASNRRGGVLPIGTGDGPDFTPVELLLVALAGCTALDVGAITGKRAVPETFEIQTTGHKVRDDGGSHLVDLEVSISKAGRATRPATSCRVPSRRPRTGSARSGVPSSSAPTSGTTCAEGLSRRWSRR
jgi:uncharacterized OsmC-like protein